MKHFFLHSHFVVLFPLFFAAESGFVRRLRAHDARMATSTYSHPKLGSHPQLPGPEDMESARAEGRREDAHAKALKRYVQARTVDPRRAIHPGAISSHPYPHPQVAGLKMTAIKKKVNSTTEKTTMCSVNQRLCAKEALALYQLGHVVGSLLERHQVTWWATGGTLLGAIRNKGIIPHDNDIDYNILDEGAQNLNTASFREDLKKNQLWMHQVHEGFWQIKPNGKLGDILHVDVFAMYRGICPSKLCYPHHWWPTNKFPESMCSGAGPSNCPMLVRWPFGKSGTVWGPPESIAKQYVFDVYGNDWHIPKCEDTNHPCSLVANVTHDATEYAEPSGPLLEPL